MSFCLRRDSETRPSQKSSQMARCFLRSISTAVLRPFSSVTNWIPVILLFSLPKKNTTRPPYRAPALRSRRAGPFNGAHGQDCVARTLLSALHSVIPSLLERHAHTVGVNRPEFLGPPRLGLQ